MPKALLVAVRSGEDREGLRLRNGPADTEQSLEGENLPELGAHGRQLVTLLPRNGSDITLP